MANNSPSGGKDSQVLRWMVSAIVAVLVIFFIWLLFCCVVLFRSSEKDILIGQLGTFGDSFGILSSLFSGIGILGVAFTLYRQHQDGVEAEERHNESVRAQERIALIQGISSLMDSNNTMKNENLGAIEFLNKALTSASEVYSKVFTTRFDDAFENFFRISRDCDSNLNLESTDEFHPACSEFMGCLSKIHNIAQQAGVYTAKDDSEKILGAFRMVVFKIRMDYWKRIDSLSISSASLRKQLESVLESVPRDAKEPA